MKVNKRLGLVVVILCLTLLPLMASGVAEATKQKMLAANSNESLLQKSDSILSVHESDYNNFIIYRTKDFRGHTNDGMYYEGYLNGRFYCYYGVYFAAMPCYDMGFNPLEDNIVFNEVLTSYETATEMKINGNQILLKTSVAPDKVQETLECFGLEYVEGDCISNSYVLDAESLLLQECTTIISRADGTVVSRAKQTLTLDAEKPEIIEEIYNRLTAENQQEVTIVLDPGTEIEEIFTGYFIEGEDIDVYLPGGYMYLYTDAACTDLYGEGENSGIVTVNRAGTLYSKHE